MVDFYRKLLGQENRQRRSIDPVVVTAGLKVLDGDRDGLLAPVSAEEVRIAMYSIGNDDKAPGPSVGI